MCRNLRAVPNTKNPRTRLDLTLVTLQHEIRRSTLHRGTTEIPRQDLERRVMRALSVVMLTPLTVTVPNQDIS